MGHETIVVVEDDAGVRALATRVLLRHGYRVHAYSNGRDALSALEAKAEPVDLIVTDVVMPEMNGKSFVDHASTLHPGVKVLYTSGYSENVIGRHGVLEPGIDFLSKPYTCEVLARRVREVLGSSVDVTT
jgi:DNA-binding NtrC family response regulator